MFPSKSDITRFAHHASDYLVSRILGAAPVFSKDSKNERWYAACFSYKGFEVRIRLGRDLDRLLERKREKERGARVREIISQITPRAKSISSILFDTFHRRNFSIPTQIRKSLEN